MTIEERTHELTALHAEIFPKVVREAPDPVAPITLNDAEIIARACNANGNSGAQFRALHHGDVSGYPSESDARWPYLRALRYWTQADAAQMKRIALASGMPQERWAEPHPGGTLLDYEIKRAIDAGGKLYDPNYYGIPTPPIIDFGEEDSGGSTPCTDTPQTPCEDRLAALQAQLDQANARIAELETQAERRESRIQTLLDERPLLLQAASEAEAERDALWQLWEADGYTPAVRFAAARALREVTLAHRQGRADKDGYVQVYRAHLAEVGHTSEKAVTEGMGVLRDGLQLITERPDPADLSEHPRFQQKAQTDYVTGLRRLVDHCRIRGLGRVERRGRPKKGEQRNIIPPCPKDERHKINAVCEVDGTVVARDLEVTVPTPESAEQGNIIPPTHSVNSPNVIPPNPSHNAPPRGHDGHGREWLQRSIERGRAEFEAELRTVTSREWVDTFAAAGGDA